MSTKVGKLTAIHGSSKADDNVCWSAGVPTLHRRWRTATNRVRHSVTTENGKGEDAHSSSSPIRVIPCISLISSQNSAISVLISSQYSAISIQIKFTPILRDLMPNNMHYRPRPNLGYKTSLSLLISPVRETESKRLTTIKTGPNTRRREG